MSARAAVERDSITTVARLTTNFEFIKLLDSFCSSANVRAIGGGRQARHAFSRLEAIVPATAVGALTQN